MPTAFCPGRCKRLTRLCSAMCPLIPVRPSDAMVFVLRAGVDLVIARLAVRTRYIDRHQLSSPSRVTLI